MLSPGAVLSERYELTERIAAGGMGEVWRGIDRLLHRPVAVKVLLPGLAADRAFIARFRTEARMMASLRHPGVVQVYDFGETALPGGGTLDYLVMEFIEGTSLAQRIDAAGKLSAAETVAIVGQVADALQAAHEAGIIHRDVKPSNLLVRPGGAIVLVDFGVARSTTGAGLTGTNVVLGSAHFMAPEQAEGKPVTPATDVYALGAVAYMCLTGRPPYIGDNPLQVIAQLVVADPPTLPIDVPPQVAAVVLRALEKDPARRHQSAAAFAAAARVALTGRGPSRRVPAPPPPAQRPFPPPPRATPSGASSSGASLSGASSSGASLSGASLSGASLSGARQTLGAPVVASAPRRNGRTALVIAAAVLVGGIAGGVAFALRDRNQPAQGRLPAGDQIDVPNFPAGGGPGDQKRVGLPSTGAVRPGSATQPGTGASARTSSGVLPSATATVSADPTATTADPDPTETTSAPATNPYTPRKICGSAFTVIDQAPLKDGGGTLLGRVYLLYNASTLKNCTVTIKTVNLDVTSDVSAYLEVEGAERKTDSGSFQFYAGPVKAAAGATCVKWGGSIGAFAYDSPFEHCG